MDDSATHTCAHGTHTQTHNTFIHHAPLTRHVALSPACGPVVCCTGSRRGWWKRQCIAGPSVPARGPGRHSWPSSPCRSVPYPAHCLSPTRTVGTPIRLRCCFKNCECECTVPRRTTPLVSWEVSLVSSVRQANNADPMQCHVKVSRVKVAGLLVDDSSALLETWCVLRC